MFENFEAHMQEIVRLAEKCPEKYKVPCFEALASALARSLAPRSEISIGQRPVQVGAINGKRPHFLDQYGIGDDELSRVYHRDGGSYAVIVRDLKAKSISQKQVRLALLLGTAGLLCGADPVIERERLVDICKKYAVFDSSNFAARMKSQRNMFLSKGNGWVLTVPGQERAAEIIKELAG